MKQVLTFSVNEGYGLIFYFMLQALLVYWSKENLSSAVTFTKCFLDSMYVY